MLCLWDCDNCPWILDSIGDRPGLGGSVDCFWPDSLCKPWRPSLRLWVALLSLTQLVVWSGLLVPRSRLYRIVKRLGTAPLQSTGRRRCAERDSDDHWSVSDSHSSDCEASDHSCDLLEVKRARKNWFNRQQRAIFLGPSCAELCLWYCWGCRRGLVWNWSWSNRRPRIKQLYFKDWLWSSSKIHKPFRRRI